MLCVHCRLSGQRQCPIVVCAAAAIIRSTTTVSTYTDASLSTTTDCLFCLLLLLWRQCSCSSIRVSSICVQSILARSCSAGLFLALYLPLVQWFGLCLFSMDYQLCGPLLFCTLRLQPFLKVDYVPISPTEFAVGYQCASGWWMWCIFSLMDLCMCVMKFLVRNARVVLLIRKFCSYCCMCAFALFSKFPSWSINIYDWHLVIFYYWLLSRILILYNDIKMWTSFTSPCTWISGETSACI